MSSPQAPVSPTKYEASDSSKEAWRSIVPKPDKQGPEVFQAVFENGLPQEEIIRRTTEINEVMRNIRAEILKCQPVAAYDAVEPKPPPRAMVKVPVNAGPAEKKKISDLNNTIGRERDRKTRERNNEAAKKSRDRRVRLIRDLRLQLAQMYVERTFWKVGAIKRGEKANAYDCVDDDLRQVFLPTEKEFSEWEADSRVRQMAATAAAASGRGLYVAPDEEHDGSADDGAFVGREDSPGYRARLRSAMPARNQNDFRRRNGG